MSENTQHIPLSQLATRVEAALSDSALREIWTVAEINNVNINSASGHCYLELIERNDRGIIVATMRANIWATRYRMINSYFEGETGRSLTIGMKILCCASVSYHPQYGLSVNISDIDPAYTVGEVERKRNQTISMLKADGVFDMNKELELPNIIQRIAVVSSSNAAGYGDFRHQLEGTPYKFNMTLFPAVMQGNDSEQSVADALGLVADQYEKFDCVVLIRGGGATTDLESFDSYLMCSYIAQMPLPVITGIGHERDTSVADLVAHTSFKTPTAVAAYMIESADNFWNSLSYFYGKIIDNTQKILLGETMRTEQLSSKITALASTAITSQTLRIERLSSQILSSAHHSVSSRRSTLDLLTQNLRHSATSILKTEKENLKHLSLLVEAKNPKNILRLGYAMITNTHGKTLTHASQIATGQMLNIELHDSTIQTTVNAIHTHEPQSK